MRADRYDARCIATYRVAPFIASAAAPAWRPVASFLLGLARGDLVLVEVAVGLRRQLERQLVVGILAVRLDLDVVQRDDARQGGDAADELAELVVAAGQADLDRQLRVEVLAAARGCGWNSFSSSPAARPVCEMSTSRFGTSVLPGSWRSMRAEGALDVRQLLLVDARGSRPWRAWSRNSLRSFCSSASSCCSARLLRRSRRRSRCSTRREHHEAQRDRAGAYRQRPAARIARVE